MVSDIIDISLVVGYLLILGLAAARYRYGKLSFQRVLLFIGISLTWLSYGVGQLTQAGPISTGTPLNYALDGLSVLLLLSGLYVMYRWWRVRDNETESGSTTD
jgi:hypothetical protein